MQKQIYRRVSAVALMAGVGFALWGAGAQPPDAHTGRRQNTPKFSHPTQITNAFVPLTSLHQDILEGKEEGHATRVERTHKPGTKTFAIYGQKVQAMIVEDKEFRDGKLSEIALDYFAQSDDGTVYYLGEDVDNYKNGKIVAHEGAWLSGVKGVLPGVLMPAQPTLGATFRPEDVPGVTWEKDEVVSLSEKVKVPAGSYANCLKVKETLSDGGVEYKYYAPKVGVVVEVPGDGKLQLKSHR